MKGFVVLGTDTNAGKTAFCIQLLTAFADRLAYWKPCETGDSDTETLRRLAPNATVFVPLASFRAAVAPVLAASLEGRAMPEIAEVIRSIPDSPLPLVIESFGSPLSPFNETTLQIELIAGLQLPTVLVSSSAVGAVGRTLQTVAGMSTHGVRPAAVVLLGARDEFAVDQIARHTGIAVFSIATVESWTREAFQSAATENFPELSRLFATLTATSTPEVSNLVARDRAVVWHPYTPLISTDDPLSVVGAYGEFLELTDGRQLIDGTSSWWTILHGHRYPPLMDSLRAASQRFDHVMFAGLTHAPGVELAERMLAVAPWQNGRVFYSDNGSTAVEVALKMAYQAWCHRGEPQRKLFVGFDNSYHGDTFGAMAAGRDPLFFGRFEPLLFQTLKIPVSAASLAETLTQHRGEVAGVILEPLVQGAGGMQMHSPEELRAIWQVAQDHGVYFIADEVMTGCGRTGSLWAFQQAGIVPDLICTSKTLAGGVLPLAATLAGPGIVSEFATDDRSRTFFHGHSFTGHPLACAVAVTNWEILARGDWQSDVTGIEAIWRERLEPLRSRPGIRDVRIRGTIAALEIDCPGGYLAEIGRLFRKTCLDLDVLLRPLGNVLYALPPLRTSSQSLHRIADALIACVDRLPDSGGRQP